MDVVAHEVIMGGESQKGNNHWGEGVSGCSEFDIGCWSHVHTYLPPFPQAIQDLPADHSLHSRGLMNESAVGQWMQ